LIREKGPPNDEWQLEWNESTFTLTAPDGTCVLEADSTFAHRLIEIYELYAEGKISFESPAGSLTFKSTPDVITDVKAFVDAGLRSDEEYRDSLKTQSRRAIARGLIMFTIGATLFGLYCWWESWAADPAPGHWLHWVGWLIHLILLVLLGMALAGPFVTYFGFRQLGRITNIERQLARENSA